jgi:hypothetical protein
VIAVNADGGKAAAQATLNGRVVVTTGLVFAFKYIDDPALEVRRAELMRIWLPEAPQPSEPHT